MKGRDALREMLAHRPSETPAVAPRRSSGAVRAMNLELDQLTAEATAAKALRERLAEGEAVVKIAPAEIDRSLVSDRISVDRDEAFEALKTSIAEQGQQVPILVRPHPEQSGRYQIAYGRRRLRAALELGIDVKAIVRDLTDRDLVIAQAQENENRADLTFIERALFAANLGAYGFDRETISTALGVDKPELSRLLTVATTVTSALIEAIGPAPKVGRPRWLELAEKCGSPDAIALAGTVAGTEKFKQASSDGRFSMVLSALSATSGGRGPARVAVEAEGGRRVAWLQRMKSGVRVSTTDAAFAVFFERRLSEIVREFESSQQIGEESST